MSSVLIVQRRLTHYRVPLFSRLKERLARQGVQLNLLVGEPEPAEALKNDAGRLDWAKQVPTRYLGPLCWQPFGEHLKGNDLVIVTQENRLLYNHWLMLRPRPLLAFWGHGGNLQASSPGTLRERFKRWTTRRVDWWFAYTSLSARLVASAGFPEQRITVLENAVDTRAMLADRQQVTAKDVESLRQSLKLTGPVGIYIGSLYKEKRLDFLLEAASRIRMLLPEFKLIVLGAGPEQAAVEGWARRHPWIHFPGPQSGVAKARYAMAADVLLNPGMVGLGILDAFCFELPIITTDCGLHSPEIAYLRPGANGLMTENSVEAYAQAVVEILANRRAIKALKSGCAAAAQRYTIENMAERFEHGIREALTMRLDPLVQT